LDRETPLSRAPTLFATGGCIARVGATPVFIDIDPETYNISPAALERYLAESCRRGEDGFLREPQGKTVRAIIPVHLFGLCCEMDAIHGISEGFQLEVIEDAAQAIGAECPFGGATGRAGAMGEVGYFSFYPSKNLAPRRRRNGDMPG
jgi:dTDP-4-amino-4,6-dideoxygalactose transaminase